jgi:hypothetical protein
VGLGSGDSSSGGFGFLLSLFGIAVEEHVRHDIPVLGARQRAAHAKNLTSEKPVEKTNRLLALVVGGNGNIDIEQR